MRRTTGWIHPAPVALVRAAGATCGRDRPLRRVRLRRRTVPTLRVGEGPGRRCGAPGPPRGPPTTPTGGGGRSCR